MCVCVCVLHFLVVLINKTTDLPVSEDVTIFHEAWNGGPEVHVGHYLPALELPVELVEDSSNDEVQDQQSRETMRKENY